MRQVEFRAYVSQSELKRLRQSKTSAGWAIGAAALALAWIFSAFGMSPSQLDFGTLQTGSGGRLAVQLTNRGMTEFHASSIALEGPNAADFGVDPQQSCTTVRSGETCVLWVQFTPHQSGEKQARLIVRSLDGKEFSSEFKGKAEGKEITKDVVPKLDDHKRETITNPLPPTDPRHGPTHEQARTTDRNPVPPDNHPPNPGPAPVDPVAQTHHPDAPPGQQDPATQWPPKQDRPPLRNPPGPAHPDPTRPSPPPPPLYAHVTMTPGITQFSGSTANAKFVAPAAHPITVTNDGTADVKNLNLRIGTPGSPFSYTPSCPTYLGRGEKCTVEVRFVPQDTKPHADSLSAYNGKTHLASVGLNATVPQQPVGRPHLTFRPGEVQFRASQSDGRVTAKQRVEVVSDGTADIQQLALKMAPPGLPFGYSGNCSTRLERQKSCFLQVTFETKSQQTYTATLGAYDGGTALASLPLRGGGGTPAGHPHVTMTPSALKFSGSIQYAMAYVPPRQTVEVRNDGPVDLRSLSLRLAPSGAPFTFSGCSSGLARGQSCITQVNFRPSNGQQSTATLSSYEAGVQLASVQLYVAGSDTTPPKSGGGPGTAVADGPKSDGTAAPGNGGRRNVPPGSSPNGTMQGTRPGGGSGSKGSNQPNGGKSTPGGSNGTVTGYVDRAYPNGTSNGGSGGNPPTGTRNGTTQVSRPGPSLRNQSQGDPSASKQPNNAGGRTSGPNHATTTIQQQPRTVVRQPPPPRRDVVVRTPPRSAKPPGPH